jgi:hypothetical protein
MAAMTMAVFAGPIFAENTADAPDSTVSTIQADGDTTGSAGEIFDSSVQANGGTAAQPADTLAAANDTSTQSAGTRAAVDDTPAQTVNTRKTVYDVTAIDSAMSFNPSRAYAADIFRGDAASVSEILRYRSVSSVSIPFSLSSSMNRLLPYGNAAPIGYLTSPALAAAPSPSYAPRYQSGDISGAQASDFILGPGSDFAWLPYPSALTAPELSIFWENGVFSQNTLSLRLSRPLSPNLMLNIFSNYRYFEGKRFDHEGNDMVAFYEIFRPDTSTIMNRGYNPLTDEHAMGAALEWYGADSSKLYASFAYGSLQNEYALNDSLRSAEYALSAPNAKTPPLDRLHWALLDRLSYRVDAALLNKKLWILDANVKTAFVTENITSLYEPDSTIANGSGGTGCFIGYADIALPFGLGASLSGIVKNMDFFNGAKETYSRGDPELFYKHGFDLGFVNANIELRAGAALFPWNDTIYMTPKAKAAATLSPNDNAKLTLYAARDGITVYPDYDIHLDSSYKAGIDNFAKFGADGTMRLGYFGVMLGYQWTTGIDSLTVKASWPQGIPPYAQPNHTIIISPWMSRWNGFSLLSRTFVTDTKPSIKTSAALSYIIQPRGMSHTFETELGFDYWSERDPITFAGHTGWNDPIYDLNLKLTAHIRTFRLFWKVDNLLNTRYAYVPGYFSPGLTFRWGINWFLL